MIVKKIKKWCQRPNWPGNLGKQKPWSVNAGSFINTIGAFRNIFSWKNNLLCVCTFIKKCLNNRPLLLQTKKRAVHLAPEKAIILITFLSKGVMYKEKYLRRCSFRKKKAGHDESARRFFLQPGWWLGIYANVYRYTSGRVYIYINTRHASLVFQAV